MSRRLDFNHLLKAALKFSLRGQNSSFSLGATVTGLQLTLRKLKVHLNLLIWLVFLLAWRQTKNYESEPYSQQTLLSILSKFFC